MKHGNIELINMDCMDLLKATPDKFYELAIVDPPYGIGIVAPGKRTFGVRKNINEIKNTINPNLNENA